MMTKKLLLTHALTLLAGLMMGAFATGLLFALMAGSETPKLPGSLGPVPHELIKSKMDKTLEN